MLQPKKLKYVYAKIWLNNLQKALKDFEPVNLKMTFLERIQFLGLLKCQSRSKMSKCKMHSQYFSSSFLQESKRAWVIPSKVEPLYTCYWSDGQVPVDYPSLAEIRQNVQDSLKTLRQDHKRSLNPTPYKVLINLIFLPFTLQK